MNVVPLPDDAFIRPRKDFVPAYLKLWEQDRSKIFEKAARAVEELRACRACPRDCGVNRLENRKAVCRTGRWALVTSSFAHLGEEDCLRGWKGSGTIFFAFCNLKCAFCQNFDISWEGRGAVECRPAELARLMVNLQERGCHNLNLVTPEHVAPQIMEAIPVAIQDGLRIPIVYNTSSYDSALSLELMDGIVDIYMPDFKFWDPAVSKRLMAAEDYPDVARARIREMHRQVGDLVFDEDGLALRGVLLRHLVMPRGLADTEKVMRFVAREVSPHTFVNVMEQYRPAGLVPRSLPSGLRMRSDGEGGRVRLKPDLYGDIDREVTSREYEEAMQAARAAGLYRFAG